MAHQKRELLSPSSNTPCLPEGFDLHDRIRSIRPLGNYIYAVAISSPVNIFDVCPTVQLHIMGTFIADGHEGDPGFRIGEYYRELRSFRRKAPIGMTWKGRKSLVTTVLRIEREELYSVFFPRC